MDTLKAVPARLFPTDDLGPGAVEANVHVFIDGALATVDEDLLPIYRQLLPIFDPAARSEGAKSFAGLPTKKQIALLEKFEAGNARGVKASEASEAFVSNGFQALLNHMREVMFADPMCGRSRSRAGWKLIGYPGVSLFSA